MLALYMLTVLAIPILASDRPSICNLCECLQSSLVECDGLALTEVPEVEGNKIRGLSFSGNSITTIPKIPHLPSLRTLSFRFNTITNIENSAFSQLFQLRSLDLSNNKLTADAFAEDTFKGRALDTFENPLESLKTLNLSGNHLERLTVQMFQQLTNLTVLSLRGNPFEDLSSSSIIAFSELTQLEDLDLANTGLRRLPSHAFADLRRLKTLDLSGNKFEFVPTEINFIPSLRNLVLNDLRWTSITPGYFYESLQNLESLQIMHSPLLTSICNYAFANLTGLNQLILSHNPRLAIMQEHSLSTEQNNTLIIEEVRLNHNHLQNLPKFAIEWSTISKLDLQHNPWQCDCNFEWIAKGLIPRIAANNKEITLYIVCASPTSLMGKSVISNDVQQTKLVCYSAFPATSNGSSFVILLAIIAGVLLLSTGTIFFSYALFKRTQSSQDWIGSHIQYRRVNQPVTPIVQ